MRHIIRTFGEFERIFESNSEPNTIEIRYPEKWKKLQDLGFYDATPPLMANNGSILLKNDKFNYYPEGITLQRSGYIRVKGVSGFLEKDQTWEMMADYLIDRFQKYENETSGGFSPEQITVLKKISKAKTEIDPDTGRVNCSGSIGINLDNFKKLKEEGLKLGKIKGDFRLNLNSGLADQFFNFTEEDFKFLPLEVGGDFGMLYIKFQDQPDFSKFPKVKKSIGFVGIEGIKTFQGINLTEGQSFVADYLPDLKYLGNSFPSTVGEFKMGSEWEIGVNFPKLKTMEGCPKKVKGKFVFCGTMIEDLRGFPQEIEASYMSAEYVIIKNNPQLKSLEGLPIDFNGYIKTDYFECDFSLKNRIEMLRTGTIYSARTGERYPMSPTARKLISSSITIDLLQKEIDENPERMAIMLKDLVKDPYLKDIKWPGNLQSEVDLLSDLSDVGL